MRNILITGGAGFIGCNLALELANQDCNIVVVDDFKNSYVQHIKNLAKHFTNIKYFKGNCCDERFMNTIFKLSNFDIVIHLAAKKYINESVAKPKEYMDNNINSLKVALEMSKRYKVKRFIFSSSSAVYGNCLKKFIDEDTSINPLNPYAQSKVVGEEMIKTWTKTTQIPATIFRFANPVGANIKHFLGDHSKKHQMQLFPYVSTRAISNEEIVLRGNNFKTPDGTPIRDYIYVGDIAKIVAHVSLNSTNKNVEILNLGSGGNGFSTLQVIQSAQKVLGKPVKYSFVPANNYEITQMVLDCSKLFSQYKITLGKSIDDIMETQIKFVKYLNKNKPC